MNTQSEASYKPDQRNLVLKHHFLGHSVEQIAQYLNMNPSAVVRIIDDAADSLNETAIGFRQRQQNSAASELEELTLGLESALHPAEHHPTLLIAYGADQLTITARQPGLTPNALEQLVGALTRALLSTTAL